MVSVMLTPTIPLPIFPLGIRTKPLALIRIFVFVRFAGTLSTAGKARSVGAWFGAGCMATKYDASDPGHWYTFSSRHSGVVNFGFMDGSVRGVTKSGPWQGRTVTPLTPRWQNFQRAAGMQDGDVIDFGQLGG